MDQLESYFLLLSDSFFTHLAIDTSTELVVHTMKIFGTYDPILIVAFAIFGFFFATIINYVLGRMIFKIVAPSDEAKQAEMNHRMDTLRDSKLLPLILAFSAAPFFGKFVILFSGFCRISLLYTISIALIAKLSYYIYLIYII